MTLRALRTPLMLAVLSLLRERPRHPYEMQTLVRERHLGDVIKLRGGSLYDAVRRLERAGLIRAAETGRAGARPERTYYAITEAGVELLGSLLRDYLRRPVPEYPTFAAGLAHIVNVDPAEAVALLREREQTIRKTCEEITEELAPWRDEMPRVVLLEVEYAQALRRAELAWLDETARAIGNGDIPWLDQSSEWRQR